MNLTLNLKKNTDYTLTDGSVITYIGTKNVKDDKNKTRTMCRIVAADGAETLISSYELKKQIVIADEKTTNGTGENSTDNKHTPAKPTDNTEAAKKTDAAVNNNPVKDVKSDDAPKQNKNEPNVPGSDPKPPKPEPKKSESSGFLEEMWDGLLWWVGITPNKK